MCAPVFSPAVCAPALCSHVCSGVWSRVWSRVCSGVRLCRVPLPCAPMCAPACVRSRLPGGRRPSPCPNSIANPRPRAKPIWAKPKAKCRGTAGTAKPNMGFVRPSSQKRDPRQRPYGTHSSNPCKKSDRCALTRASSYIDVHRVRYDCSCSCSMSSCGETCDHCVWASSVLYTHKVPSQCDDDTHMCMHRTHHVTLSEFLESSPYSKAPDHKFGNHIEDQNELESPCEETDECCSPALAMK
jgi:hypothetical protein